MKLDRYMLIANESNISFEFLYDEICPGLYNLIFGDWDEERQRIDDKARTNNSDVNKVHATVALSVHWFMASHPDSTILAIGETPAKTRLYQIGLTKHWPEISKLYNVKGFYSDDWESFTIGKNYDAFSLRMK